MIFEYNCKNENKNINKNKEKAVVVCAHLDTVFADLLEMPYVEDAQNGRAKCPGICDDTANVTAVLLAAKFFIENKILPDRGIIFLLDTQEETGGAGIKSFMEKNRQRTGKVLVFDCTNWMCICDKAVSRKEFHVKISTPGGHAQNNFGLPNAIEIAAAIIERIYAINMPKKERLVATCNVGLISGGDAKNKIASSCEFDLECRSNEAAVFDELKNEIENIILSFNKEKCEVSITSAAEKTGARCQTEEETQNMSDACAEVIRKISQKEPSYTSAVTSSNVPLSIGIPSVCVGSLYGGYIHSMKERLDLFSLEDGTKVALGFIFETL